MLEETFKARIFDSINNSLPVTFTAKDDSDVEFNVSYTPQIVRFKDKQPSNLPNPIIILNYKGGYPAKDIGSQQMGNIRTELKADFNERSAIVPTLLTGTEFVEFQLILTEKLLSKLDLWLDFPSGSPNSTSGILLQVFDENGIFITEHITYYYEITAFGWTEVLLEDLGVAVGTSFTIRVQHFDDIAGNNLGIRIYADAQSEFLFRAYRPETAELFGYFYREELEITIQAMNDESQDVPVNGYLIADKIFEHLTEIIIDWHSFAEADLERIGIPFKDEDESNPTQIIYIVKLSAFFKFIGGIVDDTQAPLIRDFKLSRISLR